MRPAILLSHVVNNWRNEMEFTKAELEVIHNALISYTNSMRRKLDVCVREQWHELAEHTLQQIDRAVTLRDRIATGGF